MLALIYLTHSELFGKKAHFQTLKKRLKGLGRGSVLSNLAVINNLYAHTEFFGKGVTDLPRIQNLLKSAYFNVETQNRIRLTKLSDRVVFTRLQNLHLARLSVLHSTDNKPVIVDGGTAGGFELGECSLIASDYILSQREMKNSGTGTDSKRIRHLSFQLSPSSELSNPLDMVLGIIRSETMYLRLLDSVEFKDVLARINLNDFDIASEFEVATGISLRDYIDITVALISYFLVPDSNGIINKIRTITVDDFLSKSELPKDIFEKYLVLESRTIDYFESEFRNDARYLDQYSFLPFKTYPLIEIQRGLHFCIDTYFLTEKLNAGLYWKIFDNLKGNKKNRFSAVYGHLFENYVRTLFRGMLETPEPDPRKGLLLPSPKYVHGDECFDEIIYFPESKHLIVVETKASFLHTEAKFGPSIIRFRTEILTKFVEKRDGTGKGVGQLAKHIGRLFAADKDIRAHIENPDFDSWIQTVEKVTPVLIVQEPSIAFHINEDWLNREFVERLKKSDIRGSVRIANLAILNIETIETLKSHITLGEITLEQCLNARKHRDPDYKNDFTSFVYSNFDLRRKIDEEMQSTLSHVFHRTAHRFFGESAIHDSEK